MWCYQLNSKARGQASVIEQGLPKIKHIFSLLCKETHVPDISNSWESVIFLNTKAEDNDTACCSQYAFSLRNVLQVQRHMRPNGISFTEPKKLGGKSYLNYLSLAQNFRLYLAIKTMIFIKFDAWTFINYFIIGIGILSIYLYTYI